MEEVEPRAADKVCMVEVDGLRLETNIYHSKEGLVGPTLVFLHEGLGSVAMWGDFPGQIVRETGLSGVVYSRVGYGKSDRRSQDYGVDYMHCEALNVLPRFLKRLGIREPILIGHSDGGTIALIFAANHNMTGLVVEAPHIFVEDICVKAIKNLSRAEKGVPLIKRLGRFHNDPQHAFDGWTSIWLKPAFKNWNIFDQLGRITCPILAIQGELDEYGTMAQVDGIAANTSGPVTLLKPRQCGHSPHRDQKHLVVQQIVSFVRRIREDDN